MCSEPARLWNRQARRPQASKARPYGAFFAYLMGLDEIEISKADLTVENDRSCCRCGLE